MAITLPASWVMQRQREIVPGGRVMCDSSGDDLESLNQQASLCFVENVQSVKGWWGLGDTIWHVVTNGTFTTLFPGYIQHWDTSLRYRLHCFGQDCDMRATIGGVVSVTVTCGAAGQWYTSAVGTLVGMALGPADGVVTAVQFRTNGATPKTGAWIIEEVREVVGNLPHDHARTYFQKLDDELFRAERPLDGFCLQQPAINSRELPRRRSRGTAIFHGQGGPGLSPSKSSFSSAYPRADGPYIYQAAPWEDRANVVVYVGAWAADVVISVFSEHELDQLQNIEDVTERAVTITGGAGATPHAFQVRLRTANNRFVDNRIWIFFRCELGAVKYYSSTPATQIDWSGAYSITCDSTVGGINCREFSVFESQVSPLQVCVAIEQDLDPALLAVKGALSSPPAFSVYDLAHNHFDGTSPDSKIWVSPNPGVFRYPTTGPIAIAGVTKPIYSYDLGRFDIYSVSICGAPSEETSNMTSEELFNSASVGKLPPALTVVDKTRQRVNSAMQWGTAILGTRHMGQGWLGADYVTGGGATRKQFGRYTFLPLPIGSFITIARFCISSDPQLGGGGGGRDVQDLFAKISFLAFEHVQSTHRRSTSLQWQIVTTGNAGANTGTTETSAVALRPLFEGFSTVTEHDAALSAVACGQDPARYELYEHNYTMQCSYLDEVFRRLWLESPIITGPLPPSYPAFVDVQMKCTDPNANGWVVCNGAGAWLGSREEAPPGP